MADNRTYRRQVDAIRSRRVDALREQARRDVAVALLEENGTVSAEDVDARMAATFVEPTDYALDNAVAQKCAAAVAHEAEQVATARERAQAARTKRERIAALVEEADAGIVEADAEVTAAEERHAAALALAEYTGAIGDVDAADPPAPGVAAPAEVASADATANGSEG